VTNVRRHGVAILFFKVTDNSGSASVSGGVYRGSRPLKRFAPKRFRNGRYHFNWRATGRVEHLRFCLRAQDAAGNKSLRRCAAISVN
jgi:hypothetical protein